MILFHGYSDYYVSVPYLLILISLAGIAPPAVRRSDTAQREREKQVNDNRHPLHGHNLPRKRLKSRNSFIHATDELIQSPSTRRLDQ